MRKQRGYMTHWSKIFFLVLLLLSIPSVNAVDSITIQTISDAFVESNAPTVNYGSYDYVLLENNAVFKHSRIYLTFPRNQSIASTDIINATLSLYGEVNLTGSTTVVGLAREVKANFNENTITWNTQPCASSSCNTTNLDSQTVGAGNQLYNWTVTYAATNTTDANITVMIITSEADNEGYRYLASRENGTASLRPKLTIFYNNTHRSNNYTNNDDLILTVPKIRTIQFNFTVLNETTYSWNVNNVLQASTSSLFTYSFSNTGTYYVNATAINQNEVQNWTVNVVDTAGNWTFNEGSGTWANDTSGNDNNGTITGATWNNTDFINSNSLYFNGSNYVRIESSQSIQISNAQSFTGWIKPQSLNGVHMIFEKGGTEWEYNLYTDGTSLSYLILNSNGVVHSITSGGTLTNDTWTFVSGTYQDGVLQTLRINDILVHSTSSFIGTTTKGVNPLKFGTRNTTEYPFIGMMDEFKLYNYVLNATELTTEYQRYQPLLTYPINGSTISATYPPQTTNINFTWHDSVYPGDELLVSTDVNFNILDVDVFTSNDFYLATLNVGEKYYWKIRQYNGTTGTYGTTSAVHNFTITSTGGATGQGIQGIVYEILGGLNVPIDQATVYIYNTTWSSLAVTGTNGYYLFPSLENGTYNMYAIKNGYDNTAVFPVNVNGSITTNDILMKIYISPYVPNFVFEKFVVRDLFDRSFVGVTTTVYKGDSLIASFTGTTDSTGSVVFQLIKDQRYRVTFSGGGISGTVTIYVYAKEESYYVRILSGFPTGGDRYGDISANLTAVSINSTHSFLELIYNDTRSSTTALNFYATNLSTNTTCTNSSVSSVVTLTCTVVAAGTYQFGFNATSSIYGFFQEDKIINFDAGKPSTPDVVTNVDSDLLQWASIILIVLTAALFSVRSVKFGAVIVPLEALSLWAFGWFEPVVNNQVGSFLLLSCAVVIGVMIYLRQSEIKVNF